MKFSSTLLLSSINFINLDILMLNCIRRQNKGRKKEEWTAERRERGKEGGE